MRWCLVVAAALALSACNCSPSGFSMTFKGDGTVEGNAAGGDLKQMPAFTGLSSLDLDQTPEFKSQGVTRSQLQSFKVVAVKLKVTSPGDQDFSFLDSVQLYARAGDKEVLVAQRSGIADLKLQAPNPEIVLDVSGEELRDLLGTPTLSLIARGKGRNPPKETRLEANVTARVDLKVL
jgi:hypothetical protein